MAKTPATTDSFAISLEALSEYVRPPGDSTRYQPLIDAALQKIENLSIADGKVRNFALEVNTSTSGNSFRSIATSNAPLFDTIIVPLQIVSDHVHQQGKGLFQRTFDDGVLSVESACISDRQTRQIVYQVDPSI